MTRVLVCGGRHFGNAASAHTRFTPAWSNACEDDAKDHGLLLTTLDEMEGQIDCVIHGGARGADALAGAWAREVGVKEVVFKADWYPRGRQGGMDRAAGPIRNTRMIREGKPDLVLAFPGGRGTEDCCRQAQAAGIPVRRVTASQGRRT